MPDSNYAPKMGIRASELKHVFGSEKYARRIVKADWLKPVIEEHRCVIYDHDDVKAAWQRLKNGEQPPRLGKGD